MHRHRPGGSDDVIYGEAGNDRIVDTTAPPWHAAVETTGLTTNGPRPVGPAVLSTEAMGRRGRS